MESYRSYVQTYELTQIDKLIFRNCRLLASRTFTFLVGPDREAIDVHANLLQSLSEPLDKLMNNGQMKESTESVAVLDEVDVDTFGLFVEFCYTRNYRLPPKVKAPGVTGAAAQVAKPGLLEATLTTSFCHNCGTPCTAKAPDVPALCIRCCSIYMNCFCVLCGLGADWNTSYPNTGPICQNCSKRPEVRRFNSFFAGAGLNRLIPHLREKKYGAMGMSHDEIRDHSGGLMPKDEPSEKLVYHAKLHVFATIYMIQSLKDLSLHKLSRDLEAFEFEDDSAGEFAELFRYVYVNTSGNDDDTIGTGSEMRDLVATWAACQAELLVENRAFLDVLEEGGEGASAFAIFMAKRL